MRKQESKQKASEVKEAAGEARAVQSRRSRVQFSRECIQINRNQIWYSKLSSEIKHVFSYTLKECNDKGNMKEVFSRWEDDQGGLQKAKMLFLNNEEGIQLIWRMQRSVERLKEGEIIQELGDSVYSLRKEYIAHQESSIKIDIKRMHLSQMNNSKAKTHQQASLLREMSQFTKEMEQKMLRIQYKIDANMESLKEKQLKLEFNFDAPSMSKILSKAISKEVRNILRESILFIVEITQGIVKEQEAHKEEVYVVFEQTYPSKRIKKADIVRILGSVAYLEKVDRFSQFMEQRVPLSDLQRHLSKNMTCCHRCLKVSNYKDLIFCDVPLTSSQTDSYPATDYFSYRKSLLEADYFNQVEEQHVLPFFQYNTNQRQQLVCNRAFCQDCNNLFKNEKEKNVSCLYCRGLCNCPRCDKSVGIVKLIALDYRNDPLQQKPYHEMLKLFGSEMHKGVSEILSLRMQYSSELRTLESVWRKCERMHVKVRPNIDILLESQRTAREGLVKEDLFSEFDSFMLPEVYGQNHEDIENNSHNSLMIDEGQVQEGPRMHNAILFDQFFVETKALTRSSSKTV